MKEMWSILYINIEMVIVGITSILRSGKETNN